MEGLNIRHTVKPGDLGRIVQLHGLLYAAEYGLDHTFEPYVAGPLADFVLRGDPRERIWIVEWQKAVAGSVAIVAAAPTRAQLRWLLLAPPIRGRGLGRRLVGEALAFARRCGYPEVFLWTLGHLAVAIHLYQASGFRLAETKPHRLWGQDLVEEKHVLRFAADSPPGIRGLRKSPQDPMMAPTRGCSPS
jgi:GNAT superfamily N-acetyltransferase